MHLPFINNDDDTDNGNGNGLGLEEPRLVSERLTRLCSGGAYEELFDGLDRVTDMLID